MFADFKSVKKLAPVAKKYVLNLGEGKIIFSEKFSTVEAYMANEAAEKQARIEARRQRVWAGTSSQVRKPLFDRKPVSADGRGQYDPQVLRPVTAVSAVNSSFGSMIAAELQKAGL